MAKQIAKIAGVKLMDVGYSGLKDRRALTRQWFRVYLPKPQDIDWSQLNCETRQFHKASRHPQQLRRGQHQSNQFIIRLRDVQGDAGAIYQRLQTIAARGVPNYFGSQRFGHAGSNLERALEMFAGRRVKREQRGHYLSADRSMLFNRVLSARVHAGNWNRLLDGEICMLAGSRGFFASEAIDAQLEQRLLVKDIHPSGPLWGKGELPSRDSAREFETTALGGLSEWCDGPEKAGLKMERRSQAPPFSVTPSRPHD